MTARAGERVIADKRDGVLHLLVHGAADAGCGEPAGAAREAAALRLSLWRALAGDQAAESPARAVVLSLRAWDWVLDDPAGGGQGEAEGAATLADICALMADGMAPVIVTLAGAVNGGGMDLALSAAYTIAQADAQLGFPQAGLGGLPEGGSVRRLARRVGAKAAMGLLTSARAVPARRALALGLIDSLASADPDDTAMAIARLIAAGRQGLPPRRDPGHGAADPAAFLDEVETARPRPGQGMRPARSALVSRIADCVAATLLLDEAEGRAFEATAVAECAASPEAAALRHLAWAARALPPAEGALPARPLSRVAVLGGASASGICGVFLAAGLEVLLIAPDGPELAEAFRQIAVAQDTAEAAGRLTAERRAADWARLDGALSADQTGEADLVIEAGEDDDAAAAGALAAIARTARRGTILACAVPRDLAALNLVLGTGLGRTGPVIGLHLPDLVQGARLMEFVVPAGAEADTRATLALLARRTGRVAIWAADGAGFVAERLLGAWNEAVASGLARGMPGEALARMLGSFGWAAPAMPGGVGHAVGRGVPDAAAATAWRGRMLAALANEGARLLMRGTLSRASDVDLAMVEGLGFPRESGGPMHMADRAGLVPLRARLRQLAADEGAAWTPSPLWDDLIRAARPAAGWRAA